MSVLNSTSLDTVAVVSKLIKRIQCLPKLNFCGFISQDSKSMKILNINLILHERIPILKILFVLSVMMVLAPFPSK